MASTAAVAAILSAKAQGDGAQYTARSVYKGRELGLLVSI